jgi:hypothetical protein
MLTDKDCPADRHGLSDPDRMIRRGRLTNIGRVTRRFMLTDKDCQTYRHGLSDWDSMICRGRLTNNV